MIQRELKGTYGRWCQSRRPIGRRHHFLRPLTSFTTIGGQQGWVCYALLLGLSRAALSNGKCSLFSSFVSSAVCVSTLLFMRS